MKNVLKAVGITTIALTAIGVAVRAMYRTHLQLQTLEGKINTKAELSYVDDLIK